MRTFAAKRRPAAVLVTIALVAAGVAIGTSVALRDDPTTDALLDGRSGVTHGTTGQGTGSGADVTQLQGDAESAAEQITSGDGLRVENRTGGPVALVFRDGDTAWVDAGEFVVVLRPCPDRLPIRAERKTGELIAERDRPCRRRDTWTVGPN